MSGEEKRYRFREKGDAFMVVDTAGGKRTIVPGTLTWNEDEAMAALERLNAAEDATRK